MPRNKPHVSPEDEELITLIKRYAQVTCRALHIWDEQQIEVLTSDVLVKLRPMWQQLRLNGLRTLVRHVTYQRVMDDHRLRNSHPGDRGVGDGKLDGFLLAQQGREDTPLEKIIQAEQDKIITASSGGATPTGPPFIAKLEEERIITAEKAAHLRQVFADTKKAFHTEAALWEEKYQGGKTLAQIAKSTGLSIATVFRRIEVFNEALRDRHRESSGGG